MTEREIFEAAVEIHETEKRSAFIGQACGQDANLKARIEALLTSHERDHGFLNVPVMEQRNSPLGGLDVQSDLTQGADNDDDEHDLSFLRPSSHPEAIGMLGHYRILQELGRGGFGIVFKAFDEKLQRLVAIKVLNPDLASTSPPRKRFLREARSAAAVRHENIVQVHSVEEEPLPWIVMEFINGQTLRERLDRTGPLEAEEILHLGWQMANGLAAAHEQGLIHRDVKPENILIESGVQQRVKITDFGLARTVDDASLTQSGLISGTPMYMSPEQATGGALDARTDLFSLGSVFYTMATGRPPFRAASTLAVLQRVVDCQPRPVREIIPETPDWLIAIIRKLHARNRDDRFASARELADLLGRCLSDLRLHGRVELPAELCLPPDSCVSTVTASPLMNGSSPEAEPSRVASPRPRFRWMVAAGVVTGVVGLTMVAGLTGGLTAAIRHLLPASVPEIQDETPSNNATGAGATVAVPVPLLSGDNDATLPARYRNPVDMEFARIPKGTGWLGGRDGVPGNREVHFTEDFYLGVHEVTQKEWQFVMGDLPSEFSRNGIAREAVKEIPDDELSRFPVEAVTWDLAQEFLRQLNVITKEPGWTYRLPTQDEWEYACRGGPVARNLESGFNYYFATHKNHLLPDEANFVENERRKPARVGSYAPNSLGLFDMHGNVDEWCFDVLDADGTQLRASRGGGAFDAFNACSAASIGRVAIPTAHFGNLGLRIARVPVPVLNVPQPATSPNDDNALALDGETSWGELPVRDDREGPFTLEAWVRPGPLNRMATILAAVRTPRGVGLSIFQNQLEAAVSYVDAPVWSTAKSHRLLNEHNFQHVAVVIDDRHLTVFLDGRQVAQSELNESHHPSGSVFGLGGFEGHSVFTGLIDEVRISRTARYRSNFQPQRRFATDEDTLALYHCDETAGDELLDSSGHHHHGKLFGVKRVRCPAIVNARSDFSREDSGKDAMAEPAKPAPPTSSRMSEESTPTPASIVSTAATSQRQDAINRFLNKTHLTTDNRKVIDDVVRRYPEQSRWSGEAGDQLFALVVRTVPQDASRGNVRSALRDLVQQQALHDCLTADAILKEFAATGLTDVVALRQALIDTSGNLEVIGQVNGALHEAALEQTIAAAYVIVPRQTISARLKEMMQLDRVRTAYRDFLHRQARSLMERRDWSAALAVWQHLHQQKLVSSALYLDAAECFQKLGRTTDMIALLREAFTVLSPAEPADFDEQIGKLALSVEHPDADALASDAFRSASGKLEMSTSN